MVDTHDAEQSIAASRTICGSTGPCLHTVQSVGAVREAAAQEGDVDVLFPPGPATALKVPFQAASSVAC